MPVRREPLGSGPADTARAAGDQHRSGQVVHVRLHAGQAACRAAQAEATISSTVCRICQFRSRAGQLAGSHDPRRVARAAGATSGVKAMPVTRATASMICRTDSPEPLPRL